tara:strand:- start:37791 stop:38960 length:1170 start_codon:yes stop_codon:yes gene_type:complete
MALLLEKKVKNQKHSRLISQDKLKVVCDGLCDNIEELLERFDIEYSCNGKLLSMACPIHGGDNATALNIYPEGDTYRGNWKCRTHGCEEVFKGSVIGFIRGILSRHKHNWEKSGDKTVSFQETLNFCLAFINQDLDKISIDHTHRDKSKFVAAIKNTSHTSEKVENGVARNVVRKHLDLKHPYYIDRGFSAEILDKYDVGYCSSKGKEMSSRIVVPVYDHDYHYMIGCTGRSIFDVCNKCKHYHETDTKCPDKNVLFLYSKWRHSKGLKTQNYLYNIWFAKKFIKTTYTAVVVESPGNVWRLEEAGIHNSVAIFGSSMSDRQKMILDASGAMNIITIMDNDEAGQKAADKIKTKCCKTYNIKNIKIKASDIADMSIQEIDEEVKPLLNM